MAEIVVDSITPQRILQKIGSYSLAFAESYKGDGNGDDGRFFDLCTSWRTENATDVVEIWLELFRRNVVLATNQGFNFAEFWGWPEVRCRDDGTSRVTSRLRMMKVTMEHKPREAN